MPTENPEVPTPAAPGRPPEACWAPNGPLSPISRVSSHSTQRSRRAKVWRPNQVLIGAGFQRDTCMPRGTLSQTPAVRLILMDPTTKAAGGTGGCSRHQGGPCSHWLRAYNAERESECLPRPRKAPEGALLYVCQSEQSPPAAFDPMLRICPRWLARQPALQLPTDIRRSPIFHFPSANGKEHADFRRVKAWPRT